MSSSRQQYPPEVNLVLAAGLALLSTGVPATRQVPACFITSLAFGLAAGIVSKGNG